MTEVVLDEKGRVAIPKKIREELKLRGGAKMTLAVEGKRIVLASPIEPEEFVQEMEGFVKTEIKESALEVKKIWEPKVK